MSELSSSAAAAKSKENFITFKSVYPESNLEETELFFQKDITELTAPDQLNFSLYCEKLLTYKLLLIFSRKEVPLVVDIVPFNYFITKDYEEAIEKLHSNSLSVAFTREGLFSDGILPKLRSSKELILKTSIRTNYVVDTPTISSIETKMLNAEGNTEFYPFKSIFIRDCYLPLIKCILLAAKESSVAVIGDPGIGKTTLIRYIFSLQTSTHRVSSSFSKLFWMTESGHWRYYDGSKIIKGSGRTDIWEDKDVLLLLDGSYNDEFLGKIRGVILFCSPERSNYYKMIKVTQGQVFTMPPWSLEEALSFFDFDPGNAGTYPFKPSVISQKPAIRRCNGVEAYGKLIEKLSDELVVAKTVNAATYSVAPAQKLFSSSDFDELRAFDSICPTKSYDEIAVFCRDYFKERFNIIGGRIRLLLDNNLSMKDLKKRVRKSLACVSSEKLISVGILDYYSDIPSILYSLIPENPDTFKGYNISFSSTFIHNAVTDKLITGQINNFQQFFAALKNHKIGGSLIGQIFEKAVHDYIVSTKKIDLFLKQLGIDVSESASKLARTEPEPADILRFEVEQIVYYDCNADLKKSFSFADNSFYLIPNQSNAPQVDGIGYDKSTKSFYFFQMTISRKHPIIISHVKKLCESIGITMKQVNYVFIVPEDIFDDFPVQNLCTATNNIASNQDLFNGQFVASVKDLNDMASFFNSRSNFIEFD